MKKKPPNKSIDSEKPSEIYKRLAANQQRLIRALVSNVFAAAKRSQFRLIRGRRRPEK